MALLTLGFWQVDRLEQKNEMITAIEQKSNEEKRSLYETESAFEDYTRSYIRGQSVSEVDPVFVGPRTHEGQSGFHILTPYKTDQDDHFLVNWGWVPADAKNNVTIVTPYHQLDVYAKQDEKQPFSPDNRPDEGLWYWADVDALSNHYDMEFTDVVLYAMNPVSSAVIPHVDVPMPRNKHKQYATFWFAMAGIWLILGAIAYRRLRS
jgi:surfeit locus 1 family protein